MVILKKVNEERCYSIPSNCGEGEGSSFEARFAYVDVNNEMAQGGNN